MESWEIAGYTLEFDEETHQYIVDGICVPSITQIMQIKFKNKYDGIPKAVLDNAGRRGTAIHKEIELYEQLGQLSEYESQELKDYKFLKRMYNFECKQNEVPIILFIDDEPVGAGRLDMVLDIDNKLGLADIKTTSSLDKEYLAYQLNLYKIGYEKCYGQKIDFLKGIHLKNGKRKFVDIPINEEMALDLVYMFQKDNKKE